MIISETEESAKNAMYRLIERACGKTVENFAFQTPARTHGVPESVIVVEELYKTEDLTKFENHHKNRSGQTNLERISTKQEP